MIEFHRYTLRSRGSLNAVSQRREFPGALIKVGEGVGCLHPWPEFGDAPAEEQLRLLREGGTSRVIERARRMAAVDGAARRRGASLFEGLEVPPSHYSWDHHQAAEAQAARVANEGWKAVKGKGSPSWRETIRWMEERCGDAGGSGAALLRVDFNGCLAPGAFEGFFQALSGEIRDRVDFIEDPVPFDAAGWRDLSRRSGLRLACDKGLVASAEGGGEAGAFAVAVLKPGRRDWRVAMDRIPKQARIVMTSAMDHAIGQSFAAWEAAMAWREMGDRMDLCGLCTEHLFEPDAFFERLRSQGGLLEIDRRGTGLGFDEVLAGLEWERW